MTCVLLQWVEWLALLAILGGGFWGAPASPPYWRYGHGILFFLILLLGILCLLGIGGNAPALHKIG